MYRRGPTRRVSRGPDEALTSGTHPPRVTGEPSVEDNRDGVDRPGRRARLYYHSYCYRCQQ